MVSTHYRICIDLVLAVEQLSARQERDGASPGERSLACQLGVQRLLLNDPKARDGWLRQRLRAAGGAADHAGRRQRESWRTVR